ncbi:MAG: hypothetical protein ACRC6M_15740 [Microcystaceae cyanobacterium]
MAAYSLDLRARIRCLIYLYRFPTWQQQLTVGLNCLTQPLMALLK